MFSVGICDDEITTCAELERMVTEICKEIGIYVSIEVWYSGVTLIEDIKKGNRVDLLFLDIALPYIDGIDIGIVIRDMKNYHMRIAYISSKRDYAMQLFQNQPIAFLIKPINKEEVSVVIRKSYKYFEEQSVVFEYKKDHNICFLSCADIMYFMSIRKKIVIALKNGEKVEYYGKLADANLKLPDYFSVIHKSFIVNRHYVKRYSYEELEIVNEEILPISKSHRNEVKKQILLEKNRRI